VLDFVDPFGPAGSLVGGAGQAGVEAGGGIFALGTRMAVHRGDETDGQGILPVRGWVPAWWGERGLSHIPSS
jgi:hypothetical protein